MKQLSRIMPTYAFDVSGVCSALYELGGMVVMHDASGCNSSYTTFDEPRWYDMDSMIYGSGLDETDAMLGNDEKLIGDVVRAAAEMNPAFIAIAGGPVPMMVGTDFRGIAEVVERRTGIPTFGFFTNGMHFYPYGAGLAFAALAERFCTDGGAEKFAAGGGKTSVNILGATPLDFSILGNVPAMKRLFAENGYPVVSVWAMGSTLNEVASAGAAGVNVVVSSCGLPAARLLRERFGTPFVAGIPIGGAAAKTLFSLIDRAARDKRDRLLGGASEHPAAGAHQTGSPGPALIIGEQIYADSLRFCLTAEYGFHHVRTLCPLDPEEWLLLPGDLAANAEEDIEEAMAESDFIFADPLYRPLLAQNSGKCFADMPHEAFSGRIYRKQSPLMIGTAIYGHLENFLPPMRKRQGL